MSTPNIDPEAERDVDLSRWRAALVTRWWIVAAGVAAGIVVGGLYSLSGGSVYEASALLVPSQAFTTNGAPVLSYTSSPLAINALATQESTLVEAAKKAHVAVSALRGHVSTSTVSTGAGAAANRGAVLIKITVQLPKPKETADAANALGNIIATKSTGPYVRQSIAALVQNLASAQRRLVSVTAVVDAYSHLLATEKLDPFDKLILSTNADNAILRQGNLNDTIQAESQQLTLAKNVELASILSPAAALKTTARSRRNSILAGLLIGLIFGGIAAIVVDTRKRP